MAIKDLKIKEGNVNLVAEVAEIGEVREFSKFGRNGRVATAKLKDDSGTINLSLWNDDIDKIKVGDTVKITNGFVNEWQGEPQLTTGRMGKLEVIAAQEEGDYTTEEGSE